MGGHALSIKLSNVGFLKGGSQLIIQTLGTPELVGTVYRPRVHKNAMAPGWELCIIVAHVFTVKR